jgi:hypothetical protein
MVPSRSTSAQDGIACLLRPTGKRCGTDSRLGRTLRTSPPPPWAPRGCDLSGHLPLHPFVLAPGRSSRFCASAMHAMRPRCHVLSRGTPGQGGTRVQPRAQSPPAPGNARRAREHCHAAARVPVEAYAAPSMIRVPGGTRPSRGRRRASHGPSSLPANAREQQQASSARRGDGVTLTPARLTAPGPPADRRCQSPR